MPALKSLQAAVPSARRRHQSWQEQMAVMGQWIAVTQRAEAAKKARG